MYQLEACLSNDAARALRTEIRRFLVVLGEKVSGDRRDKNDTATLAYVALMEIKTKLDNHIGRLDRDEQRALRRDPQPVREQRDFR